MQAINILARGVASLFMLGLVVLGLMVAFVYWDGYQTEQRRVASNAAVTTEMRARIATMQAAHKLDCDAVGAPQYPDCISDLDRLVAEDPR